VGEEGRGAAVSALTRFVQRYSRPKAEARPPIWVTHTSREFNAVTDRDQSWTMGTLNAYVYKYNMYNVIYIYIICKCTYNKYTRSRAHITKSTCKLLRINGNYVDDYAKISVTYYNDDDNARTTEVTHCFSALYK